MYFSFCLYLFSSFFTPTSLFPPFFLNSLSLSLSYTSIKSEIINVCILSLPLSVSLYLSLTLYLFVNLFLFYLSLLSFYLLKVFFLFFFYLNPFPKFLCLFITNFNLFLKQNIFCKINVFYFYFNVSPLFSLPHSCTHTSTLTIC